MERTKRKPQLNFEAKPELINDLKKVSEALEIPAAQIMRQAVKKEIAVLHEQIEAERETALSK